MWSPALADGHAPLYERLVRRLAADIETGALEPGQRLPPQRDLAFKLGLGIGTVTRAYAEAERRGLITGHVGRGSFVAPLPEPRAASAGPIDLARNLPPLGPAEARLPGALARLSRRPDVAGQLGYPPVAGHEAQRRASATWLKRTANFESADWRQLICCAGAQQATAVAFGVYCRPGQPVIAESATFNGLKALAAQSGCPIVPAAMDGEGLTPEGLEKAARESGAKVAYVLPVQNPTGRVMGAQRRRAIVETARRLDLILVEDDLYAAHAAHLGHPPLAALAPERVCYVGGLSKAIAPGLRFGFLIPPADAFEAALDALRAIAFSAPTLTGYLVAQWVEDGEAYVILEEVRAALAARAALARRILGPAIEPNPMTGAPHFWLPMDELTAERVAGAALRAGVALTPPRAMVLDGCPVEGLRLCLGGARDLGELEAGLTVVREALAEGPAVSARDLV